MGGAWAAGRGPVGRVAVRNVLNEYSHINDARNASFAVSVSVGRCLARTQAGQPASPALPLIHFIAISVALA